MIERGRNHPFVGKVFREGLTAIRDQILQANPELLPKATSNHCFFCWHVLAKGIWDRVQKEESACLGSGGPYEKIRLSLQMLDEMQDSHKTSHCHRSSMD